MIFKFVHQYHFFKTKFCLRFLSTVLSILQLFFMLEPLHVFLNVCTSERITGTYRFGTVSIVILFQTSNCRENRLIMTASLRY